MKACSMLTVLLFAFLLLNLQTEGFVVVQKPNTPPTLITTVSLHPDQAKELEACALDLTKSYVVKSSSSRRRRSAKGGPINVIRRLWAGGYYPLEEDYARQSATSKTKALGSKKP
jgi:hypothetical protein